MARRRMGRKQWRTAGGERKEEVVRAAGAKEMGSGRDHIAQHISGRATHTAGPCGLRAASLTQVATSESSVGSEQTQ